MDKNNNELHDLEAKLIDRAMEVREEFIRLKDLEKISIRKDLLLVELKDIIQENTSFYSLKNALENYIQKIEGEINGRQ